MLSIWAWCTTFWNMVYCLRASSCDKLQNRLYLNQTQAPSLDDSSGCRVLTMSPNDRLRVSWLHL